MERSRNLILTKWTLANDSLLKYFEGNKSKLANHVKMSRTTVTNFFGEKPVRESEFRKICFALRLNWQEISKIEVIASQQENEQRNDTDTLIEEIRERCRQKILNQHSRMRLLSGDEIGVDQLYVDVWLLNRSPRTFLVSPSKLLETFDLRNDRLGLGARIQRNPGFKVANTEAKLVILGKPGSGKTTFLKHLAIDWCKGKFQPDSIAILIEFRRIRDEHWGLMYALEEGLGLENWSQIQKINKKISNLKQQIIDLEQQQSRLMTQKYSDLRQQNLEKIAQEKQQKKANIELLEHQVESLPLQILLKQGNLLILMDGLDEMPTSELRCKVQDQLSLLLKKYPENRLILTCRTQIMASIPVGFTSVEVADFNTEQIKQFVHNCFTASGKSNAEALQKWETFDNAVGKNPALKELTVTPVLLSLMCLVLQDEGEMPSQVDWLYQKGIKLLLSKWNDAKDIASWEVGTETYRRLSIEQKEALLIEIAAHKFENPKNFVLFQQEEITTHIANFLNLTNPKEKVAVLKAIEAQHGLLIERADELWSFSHLTFQEHFTIRWLRQLPSEQLAKKIANQRWQEVIKQLVKYQNPVDKLVLLIKQAIDQSIKSEPKLQELLIWVLQKSGSMPANYKPTAIRAFYFALTCALDRDLGRACVLDFARALDLASGLARALALALDSDLNLACNLVHTLVHFDFDDVRAPALARALDPILTRALTRSLTYALACALDPELANRLEQIREALPWRTNSTQWSEQLRQVMIENLNIGHNWQFSDSQKQQLQCYYNANKFLVDLIKIEGAVSDTTRTEIEDTLLLPWEELQRHSKIYRQE